MPWRLTLCSILLAQSTAMLTAQVVRLGSVGLKPRFITGDTLTLTATPSAVSFQLVSKGTATGSAPVSVSTTWGGLSLLSSIAVYASFLDATAALTGGNPITKIPSFCISGRDPTGAPTTFTTFSQSNQLGGAGASLSLYTASDS